VDEHRIEKESREAFFEMSDGSSLQGEVFLRLYEGDHSGTERFGELLNEEKPFIPVKTTEGVTLLNLSQIAWARIREEWEKDELLTMGKKRAVQIRMVGGRTIAGEVFINLPDGYDRVRDYVNQAARFYPIFQPDHVVFINPRLILSVQD
jgi:hypothetical protein